MFTGIVQGLAKIEKIDSSDELSRLLVSFPSGALTGLTRGASIALNGCCLTVTEFNSNDNVAYFDVMRESLRVTNLGVMSEGDTVNFERAAKIGDEIGGHMMSGHISATVALISRNETALKSRFRKCSCAAANKSRRTLSERPPDGLPSAAGLLDESLMFYLVLQIYLIKRLIK